MSTKFVADRTFTPASISVVSGSAFPRGLLPAERRAAARGLLRHKHHDLDRQALASPNELHPSYLELHGRGDAKGGEQCEIKAVLSDSFNDLLDAASNLDHIDGGVSMILRCPAYAPSPAISAEDITVDIYISPRELAEGGKPITENVALIVQAFGEHLVIPHLHRYQKMCLAAGVVPLPAPASGELLLVDGPSHLPPPLLKGSSCIRCRCRPPNTFIKDLAIRKMAQRVPLTSKPTQTRRTKVIAEVIISDNEDETSEEKAVALESDEDLVTHASQNKRQSQADGFQGALISIGPRTDAVFDQFKLKDTLLPQIRVLINKKRSSIWERTFRDKKWNLTYEQADKLTQAILADIIAEKSLSSAKSRSCYEPTISTFLLIIVLAILTALFFV